MTHVCHAAKCHINLQHPEPGGPTGHSSHATSWLSQHHDKKNQRPLATLIAAAKSVMACDAITIASSKGIMGKT